MTENPLRITNQAAIRPEQRTHMVKESVWNQLYPLNPDYGFKSPDRFRKSIERSVVRHKRPIVCVFLAGPNEGKTHAKEALASEMKRPGGRIAMMEKETGESFEFDEINWGDIISAAKILGLIEPDTKFGRLREPEDTDAATSVFQLDNVRWLQDNQGKRRMLFDELPVSGAWVNGLLGVNRGLSTMWRMARHLGPFKDLAYDIYFGGVVAHPNVADYALEIRSRLVASDISATQAIEILREKGEEVSPESRERVERYRHESPNVAAITMFREIEDDLARRMAEAGKFPLDLEIFPWEREYRARTIGEVIKVILRDSVRAQSDRAFIGYNREFVERRDFAKVPINNVIWQRYPEIVRIVNK